MQIQYILLKTLFIIILYTSLSSLKFLYSFKINTNKLPTQLNNNPIGLRANNIKDTFLSQATTTNSPNHDDDSLSNPLSTDNAFKRKHGPLSISKHEREIPATTTVDLYLSQNNLTELEKVIRSQRFNVTNPLNEIKKELKVEDYFESIRPGGLLGVVGPEVILTPTGLQDSVISLMQQVRTTIQKLKPLPLRQLLISLPPEIISLQQLTEWEKNIPWIHLIQDLLKTSCPNSDIDQAGLSDDDNNSFPTCLFNYIKALPKDIFMEIGVHLRYILKNATQLDEILSPRSGLCLPVRNALNLPKEFCINIYQLFHSLPWFLNISENIQMMEKVHYGKNISMLQMPTESITKDYSPLYWHEESYGPEANTKKVFSELWSMLAVIPFKTEREHLLQLWFTDDIHKWRYSLGIFWWLTITGTWLSIESNKVLLEIQPQ